MSEFHKINGSRYKLLVLVEEFTPKSLAGFMLGCSVPLVVNVSVYDEENSKVIDEVKQEVEFVPKGMNVPFSGIMQGSTKEDMTALAIGLHFKASRSGNEVTATCKFLRPNKFVLNHG